MNSIVLILILTNLFSLLLLFIILIRRKNKIIDEIIERIDVTKLESFNCFSKYAMEVYIDILNNPDTWVLTEHTLNKIGNDTKIWASNGVESRRFYCHTTENQEYQDLAKSVNSKLTYYDQVLFDKIITSYKNRQSKLVTKFFV